MSALKKNTVNRAIMACLIIWLMLSSTCTFSMICVILPPNYTTPVIGLSDDNWTSSLKKAFHDENFTDYHIYQSVNFTDFSNTIQRLSSGTCSIILGLTSTQECMIAGPMLQEYKTIAISACFINKITQFFPYINSVSPTLEHFSLLTANYIDHTKNSGRIFAFYQPSDIYSSTGYHYFKKYTHKPVTDIRVNSNGEFNLKKFNPNINTPATLIFFTYPLPSSQILIQLDSNNLINNKTNIIGDSSWIFELSAIKSIKFILNKANWVVAQSFVDLKLMADSPFYKEFTKSKHQRPDIHEAMAYDITRFSTECYNKSIKESGQFTNGDFLTCLHTTQYQGITGAIEFKADSPFATRDSHFINLQKWLEQ